MAQLPEELISHIFSYLRISAEPKAYRDDRIKLSTLASVALANKAFNRAARPHLYCTIRIESDDYATRSRPILGTLVQQPDTARLVQHLHTETWQTQASNGGRSIQLVPVPSALRAQLLAAAETLQISMALRQELQDGIAEGSEDAEYALLLGLCTNLQTWKAACVFAFEDSLVYRVVREAVTNHPRSDDRSHTSPLQQLREVNMRHWDTEGSTDLSVLASVFSLPALETFRGHMLKCEGSVGLPASVHSKLKRIYLESSILDGSGLQHLLVACPDLEVLSMHWGSAVVGVSRIEYDVMGEALRQHGTRLRTLRLKPEDAFTIDDNPETYPPLGSLKQMASLRLLAVPYATLFGGIDLSSERSADWLRETLPTALRTLRISDADEDDSELLDEQLLEVMRDQQFAELSTIRIHRGEPFTEDAEALGWDASESTKFWVVLKRISSHNDA